MYLGIDIGGTNVRIGVFAKKNPAKLLKKKSYKVNSEFEIAISQLIKDIENLTVNKKIAGIGIGVPGLINSKEGYIERAANLRSWEKKPLAKTLAKQFNTPVKVEHDVAVAALGESLFGHGKNKDKFLYIIWGTGFAGAMVEKIAGKLKISSIEPGHQIINRNGPACACGQRGCLEAYIGGKAAQKHYGKPLAELKNNKTWDAIAQKAAHGLLNTIMHYPVDLIVFGDGVISKQEHLLARINKILNEKMVVFNTPQLTLAKLGEDSALYGAAGLFFADRLS